MRIVFMGLLLGLVGCGKEYAALDHLFHTTYGCKATFTTSEDPETLSVTVEEKTVCYEVPDDYLGDR